MTDAKLDLMIEADNGRRWEELNREDPKAQAAATKLRLAISLIEQAEGMIADAADILEDTPKTDSIASINMDLEDVEIALRDEVRGLA